MRIRFWGTRGSIATPGRTTVRYGGNTSCVEARTASGTLIVLDCGTGAVALGESLVASGSVRGHLLLTHTHWDHIQGFPFFAPLFRPGHEWDIYAPRGLRESLQQTLAGQMQYAYFPVALERLGAKIRYHDLVEGTFAIDDVRVTTRYLNHPALTLGYRLAADGVAVVYATDHEPHTRALATMTGAVELAGEDLRHAEFVAGADLLIHDAQYTAAEYAGKAGWGHSTVEAVVETACAAAVRTLALFHHDPARDDDAVDRLVSAARRQVEARGVGLVVSAAAEGQGLDVIPRLDSLDPPMPLRLSATMDPAPALVSPSLLVVATDVATVTLLAEAAREDEVRLLRAGTAREAIGIARDERPTLIAIERRLPDADGLELCRSLRVAAQDTPIILVTARDSAEDRRAGAEVGVTDWLVAPFSMLYARTRLRAWLMRRACRWVPAPPTHDEPARLQALSELDVLEGALGEPFDRLTRLAQRLFGVPVALISLVDSQRQVFKARQGLEISETPREVSFCAHAIHGEAPFVVPDALLDPRFGDNPVVTGDPRIRFYAGCPIRSPAGWPLGTLCIIDWRPRSLSADDLLVLCDLARLVEDELSRGRASRSPDGPVR